MTLTQKGVLSALAAVAAAGVTVAVVSGGIPASREATVPGGTALVGALAHGVSTEDARVGDHVELRTTEPIRLDEGAAIPAEAVLLGEVTHTKRGGRIGGAPELTLRFTALEIDGERYSVITEPLFLQGVGDGKESAMEIGGGAVAGGILGAVLGGDPVKGAVIGAAVGTGVAVATRGPDIALAAGQRVSIRLRESVTVQYRPAPEPAEEPRED